MVSGPPTGANSEVVKSLSQPSVTTESASVDSTNRNIEIFELEIFGRRNSRMVLKSKTGICYTPATIHIVFTLYLQLFT